MYSQNVKPTGSLISYFSHLASVHHGINLAQGVCGFHPPKFLLNQLQSESQISGKLHQYPPGNGDSRLLEHLASHYSQYQSLTTDSVLIVQGATEGIALVFLYCNTVLKENYSALSFDPPYESFPKLSEIYNIPFVYFNYNPDFTIDFNNLEKYIVDHHVKLVMIASPGNPLGKIWNQNELEIINALSQKYDFYILFDAVYESIYFKTVPFNPLTLKNPRLFFVGSFSKMLSVTGWRIGYIITNTEHMKKIRAIHNYTGLCAPTLFQRVLAKYLDAHSFDGEYQAFIRNQCHKSYHLLKNSLVSLNFEISPVEGGYFIWAKLPNAFPDGFLFAKSLFKQEKVAVVPGENFSPNKRPYVRLNFALSSKVIHKAFKGFKHFFDTKK